MSTEINIKVDRALLLQRDQQQRQAQRQFVLEKNGQRLVVNRGQTSAAQSGARGGENRVVTSTRSAATTAALPKVPVTAGYQRKPLPDLAIGAAAQGADAGSYLLLPKPYGDLSFPHYGGEPITGYEVSTVGSGLRTLYAVNSSDYAYDNYARWFSNPILDPAKYQRLLNNVGPNAYRPAVEGGAWTMAGPYFTSPGLENDFSDDIRGEYYRLLDFGKSTDFSSALGPYTYPPLASQAFTFEYLVRPGALAPIYKTFQMLVTWVVTWFGTFITVNYLREDDGEEQSYYFDCYLKPTTRTLDTPFTVRLDYASQYQAYYGTPTWRGGYTHPNFSNKTPNEKVPVNAFGQYNHVATVFSNGIFSFYINGSRVKEASATSLGWTGAVQPTSTSGYAPYLCIYSYAGNNQDPYGITTEIPSEPLVRPAIKGIRFTADRALYTGDSFSPPTNLTRLA